LTRASILFAKSFFAKVMDCRVKPGNDKTTPAFAAGAPIGQQRRRFVLARQRNGTKLSTFTASAARERVPQAQEK
jgi:hypothetical protein